MCQITINPRLGKYDPEIVSHKLIMLLCTCHLQFLLTLYSKKFQYPLFIARVSKNSLPL